MRLVMKITDFAIFAVDDSPHLSFPEVRINDDVMTTPFVAINLELGDFVTPRSFR